MVEKKFYLSSKKGLQEIGMRAQIVSFLIAHGIKKGNAINDPKDTHKVIVAVSDEKEEKIEDIRKELARYLKGLSKNDCYKEFPRDISASRLMELNNPHPISVVGLSELSHSLMLEQTSKGVGAMRSIVDAIHENSTMMLKELRPLRALPQAIKQSNGLLKELKSLRGLPKAIKTLSKRA